MRKVDLRMEEQQKHDVIKRLADTNGNKDTSVLMTCLINLMKLEHATSPGILSVPAG
ncbi:MAG: hypothetical protein K6C05_01140 [Anaerovibrio sp.]|uniref:hypothetical protein n=1 Tax=Anaerovibrio sp. TaxID=1872532 RepID=UPI0025F111BF|nr:hypothetical protein [Anaerovibrio sp.]MCR5175435.1 hypothetical protein [Anaerovibrio sp.]